MRNWKRAVSVMIIALVVVFMAMLPFYFMMKAGA